MNKQENKTVYQEDQVTLYSYTYIRHHISVPVADYQGANADDHDHKRYCRRVVQRPPHLLTWFIHASESPWRSPRDGIITSPARRRSGDMTRRPSSAPEAS